MAVASRQEESPSKAALNALVPTPLKVFSFAIAFLAVDITSYFLPPIIGVAFALAVSLSIIVIAPISVYRSLICMIAILILSDDLGRGSSLSPGAEPTSILTVSIASISLINFVTLWIIGIGFLVAVLRWSRRPKIGMPSPVAMALIAIGALYIVGTIHGVSSVIANPRGALNDLSLPLMSLGLACILRQNLNKRQLMTLWGVLLSAMAAKALVWPLYFALGIGAEHGSTLRPSNESGRILLVLLLSFGFVMQSGAVHSTYRQKLLSILIAGASAFIIFITGSRGTWLAAIVASTILWLFSKVADKLKVSVLITLVAAGIILGIQTLRPDTFRTLKYFAGTIKFWENEGMGYSESNLVRIYEFKNIHAQLVDNRNLFLGEGPGSTFSDAYHQFPMPLRESDYPIEEILRRRFETPHSIIAILILNFGYVGMVGYFAAIGIIFFRLLMHWRTMVPGLQRQFLLMYLSYYPTAVYYCWTSKTNMVYGVVLGTAWIFDLGFREQRQRIYFDLRPVIATAIGRWRRV